jgi:hypothetical protein
VIEVIRKINIGKLTLAVSGVAAVISGFAVCVVTGLFMKLSLPYFNFDFAFILILLGNIASALGGILIYEANRNRKGM